MLTKLLKSFGWPPARLPAAFEPLYSLEQLEAISRLPVVCFRPITTARAESNDTIAGPGTAGVITNLLRRNLLLSSQLSVIGIEDTGICSDPLPEGTIHPIPEFDNCEVVVDGQLHHLEGTKHRLHLQLQRENRDAEQFTIRFDQNQLSKLLAHVSGELARRLGVHPTAAMQSACETNCPLDWNSLCLAGACWEQEDWPLLLKLAQQHRIHADSLCGLSRLDESSLTRAAFAFGSNADPTNPQLLFFHFIAIWKGNSRHQPEAAALLRRALTAAPGHGKSQMCLPHVTPLHPDSIPFVLAHSRAGYHLLRSNSFALSNYSRYLEALSPANPERPDLLWRAIELDPVSPLVYRDAVNFLLSQNRPHEAIVVARTLVEICSPPVDQRTVYCLRQVPLQAAKMDRGELTPQSYAAECLASCERAIAGA